METLQKVLDIANEARAWAEKKQRNYQFFYAQNLCGMCAKASGYLFEQLKEAGIPAKLALTSNHCFVLVDNHIVDITATQFGREKVMVKELKDEDGHFWREPMIFEDIEVLVRYQQKAGWEYHQLAKLID